MTSGLEPGRRSRIRIGDRDSADELLIDHWDYDVRSEIVVPEDGFIRRARRASNVDEPIEPQTHVVCWVRPSAHAFMADVVVGAPLSDLTRISFGLPKACDFW